MAKYSTVRICHNSFDQSPTDVHFIWALLWQTMLQWKCITHVCIHMCNYRKDGICKIKSWKWNYSQQVHAFEMLCDITKLLFKQIPIFTVTNNVISMPVSPPTFTKCFFLMERGRAESHSYPIVSSCTSDITHDITTSWKFHPWIPNPEISV